MAMPFHSTETLKEAEELLDQYCRLGRDDRFKIQRTWDYNDILTAMKNAQELFGLETNVED